MAKIGIYYGSDTGSTKSVAEKLAKGLGVEKNDIYDVSSATADFSAYDVLLFGSSTMGIGDLQDDWDSFITQVKKANLGGKKVGIFGCGDSSSYSDSFCDAVGKIYEDIKNSGCIIIGKTSTEGYSFDSSEALVDGQFIGLLIDEDNESEMTDQRVSMWINEIKKEI